MSNFANPQEDTNVLRLVLASGTVALPSVVFANDVTKGLYWDTNGLHLTGLATPVNAGDAANKAYVDGSGGGVSYPLLAPDGSVSAPSFSFASNPLSGFYWDGGSVGVSANGAETLIVSQDIVTTGSNTDLFSNFNSPLDPTATSGFVFVAVSTGGAPTGVPAQGNGATFFDSATNKFYIYNGGWKSVTLS
jgi:hypothetical protein